MKHAVLGAGAIGGMLGTALASLGHEVTLIVRPDKVAGYPHQVRLDRPADSLTGTVKVASDSSEPADALWIATKTYQLEEALKSVVLRPPAIVPLLNGVEHIELLRSRYGHGGVIPATIAVEAERISEGHFVQRSPVRLNLASSGESLLSDTAQELRDLGFLCSFIPNEASLMWGKLCFLGPFALVTAASGKNLGEIQADAEWKQKLEYAFAEAKAVGEAHGAVIDMNRIQAVVDSSPATMRSSMAKDLAAGRPLELKGIAGPILHGAAQFGIGIPTTKSLVDRIMELDSSKK